MTEVKFTANERRILGIPFNQKTDSPEDVALRKILDKFPFMLEVVEYCFDERISKAYINLSAAKIELEQAILSYEKRKGEQNENSPQTSS